MPIGLVFSIALIEAVRWITGSERVMGSARVLAPAAAVSAILTAGLGLVLVQQGGYSGPAVILHRNLGLVAAFVTTGAAALLWLAVRTPARYLLPYRVSLAIALVAITAAGHLGASITHGPDFLAVPSAPAFDTPAAACSDDTAAYQAAAILETKCVRCHGEGVSLGKLRLDDRTLQRRGGGSGQPGLVPGDPGASSVIRAVLRDPKSPKAMPPGPHKLSGEEVLTLIEWVQQGAVSCGD
jgi:uncharacterized membrane protein